MNIKWIYEPTMSDYENLLFHNALNGHKDVFRYHPIALAKHEEYGMKYRFLCIASAQSDPVPYTCFADVEIYKPLKGKPYITSIFRLDFDQMFPQRYPYK